MAVASLEAATNFINTGLPHILINNQRRDSPPSSSLGNDFDGEDIPELADGSDSEDEERMSLREDSSDAETVMIDVELDRIEGNMVFHDDDAYGPMFCELSKLPLMEVIFTKKVSIAISEAVNKLCKEYIKAPSAKALFDIMALPRLMMGKDKKDRMLMANIRELGKGKAHDILSDRLRTAKVQPHCGAPLNGNGDPLVMSKREILRATKLLEQGKVRKSAQVVQNGDGKLANISHEVIHELLRLQPVGVVNPFGNSAGPQPPILKNRELLQEMVNDLDKQTAPGISGWTTQLIQLCFGHEGEEATEPFRDFLFFYFKSIVAGTAPGQSMMCAARLIPINKKQFVAGFIGPLQLRPIAVGEMFYRLGIRFALEELNVRQYMGVRQFGCGTPGGVEPVIEMMQQLVDACTPEYKFTAHLLDIENAYNRVKRSFLASTIRKNAPQLFRLAKWLYNSRTPLVVSSGGKLVILASSDGVRQGAPEATPFFNICVGQLLVEMEEQVCEVGKDLVMSYADDIAVVSGNDAIKAEVVRFFGDNEGRSGLKLNLQKCEDYDLLAVKKGDQSMPMLGSMIGTVEHRRAFLVAKIVEVEAIAERLKQMPKQHAALILRKSTANKLRHLLRCMDLRDLEPEVRRIDELIYNMVDHLRALSDGEARGPLAEAITNWPTRLGGLGILSHAATRGCAVEASNEASRRLLLEKGLISNQSMSDLAELLSSEGVADADNRYLQFGPVPAPHYDPAAPLMKQSALVDAKMKADMAEWFSKLTPEQQLQFIDNSDSLKWVEALPNGKWRSLTDKQLAACLNILMLRPRSLGPLCPFCAQPNSLTHFELCAACQIVSAMTHYRHNCDRDCIAKGGNKITGQVVTIEPLVRDELPPGLPQPVNIAGQALPQPPVPPPPDPPPPPPPPPVFFAAQAQPQYNPNQQINAKRADLKVRVHGVAREHQYCGLLDIASKVVASRHTEAARLQAFNRATVAGILDPQKRARMAIQAALQVGYDGKMRSYREAIAAGVKITPLIISTGCTLHSEFRKALKAIIPDGLLRSSVLTDISIYMARGRAQLYCSVLEGM